MRLRAAWLFSPRADLSILFVPLALTLATYVLALRAGSPQAVAERAYAGWIAQFILGNSTHVILTFFLLGARRDVLHATTTQARIVLGGSLATIVVSFAFLWFTQKTYPSLLDFGTAVTLTFATHHTLSQVKGIWSLYNMRSGTRPSDRERRLQSNYVAIGLLLIMVKFLFVPKTHESLYPYIQPIPGEPAFLPFWATYVLLGAWVVYGALLARTVLRAEQVSAPKLVYLTVHLFTVALTVATPGWGLILAAGIHGLEYYFLCGRMLEPTGEEASSRLRGARVWLGMAVSMTPLFVVGVLNAPFTGRLLGAATANQHADAFTVARMLLNSVVLAHYFADAFIYRFRIPEIRRVALARLGFA